MQRKCSGFMPTLIAVPNRPDAFRISFRISFRFSRVNRLFFAHIVERMRKLFHIQKRQKPLEYKKKPVITTITGFPLYGGVGGIRTLSKSSKSVENTAIIITVLNFVSIFNYFFHSHFLFWSKVSLSCITRSNSPLSATNTSQQIPNFGASRIFRSNALSTIASRALDSCVIVLTINSPPI